MREQIWQARSDLEIYAKISEAEFNYIKDCLGSPRVVFEFGCGLGRGSIYLNRHFSDPQILYIMADRDGYTENTGAYSPTKDEYYNDFALMESFCHLNGLQNMQQFDTELGDWRSLPKADLILSLNCIGMHIPISRYLERLQSIAHSGTVMILGIWPSRKNETVDGLGAVPSASIQHIEGFRTDNLLPDEDFLIVTHLVSNSAAG